MERAVLGAVQRRRGPGISAIDEVVHGHPPLRARSRGGLQLRRRLPRRRRYRDVRDAGWVASDRGPAYPPREFWDRRPVAIDIYNNNISNAHDNSIEMDGSMHNIRLMRNVLINSASHPMSTQPSVGGPIYWIRNIVYHAPGGSTRMTAGSPGVIFYHNTVTTETAATSANSHWRNNLMLGQGTGAGDLQRENATPYSSSDYNGFRLNPDATDRSNGMSVAWNAVRRRPVIRTPRLQNRAAVGAIEGQHQPEPLRGHGAAAGRLQPRGLRRSPTTRRRPARISTASRSTTTCS